MWRTNISKNTDDKSTGDVSFPKAHHLNFGFATPPNPKVFGSGPHVIRTAKVQGVWWMVLLVATIQALAWVPVCHYSTQAPQWHETTVSFGRQ